MKVFMQNFSRLSRSKRTRLILCLALLSSALLPFRAYAQYSGGSGTLASPYLISNATDLSTLQRLVLFQKSQCILLM